MQRMHVANSDKRKHSVNTFLFLTTMVIILGWLVERSASFRTFEALFGDVARVVQLRDGVGLECDVLGF